MADKFGVTFYRTFKRSCTNWEEFGSARKMTEETGLTCAEAQERCETFNGRLTSRQLKKGTKLEFEAQ